MMDRPIGNLWKSHGWRIGSRSLVIGLAILFLLDLGTFLLAEGLWFAEVDYFSVFTTRLLTQGIVAVASFAITLGILWRQLTLAQQQAWSEFPLEIEVVKRFGYLRLWLLLPIVLLLSLSISSLLLYHGQIATDHWHPNLSLSATETALPLKFNPRVVWQILQTWQTQQWQPLTIVGLSIALLFYPLLLLRGLALLMSLSVALVLSEHWFNLLLALFPIPFGQRDPIFDHDISFYVFTLPGWELLEFWLMGLCWLSFLTVALVYLLSGNSLSQGYFPGFLPAQQRHLYRLAGLLLLVTAPSYWFDRYALLYSPSTSVVAYGASYTDITARLPLYTLFSLLALGLGILFLVRSATLRSTPDRSTPLRNRGTAAPPPRSSPSSFWQVPIAPPLHPRPRISRMVWLVSGYILLIVGMSAIVPTAVQRLIVQPNELQLEQPYIRHTIDLTRKAFDLQKIRVEVFDPTNGLTQADLQTNERTVANIRLWDTTPLLETNRQLQRIRLYYEFPDADIDRYPLPTETGEILQQQVLIAARELDYNSVPAVAQTWVNQHLIYTHGYGFTVSPVNQAEESGLPDYFIQGIEPVIVDPRIQSSIPVGKPRIYYGELTNTYVMTQTRVPELDYPSGSDNVYNFYDGRGGVPIGSLWQRWLYAKHLRDWRMLFTDDFTPNTRLLFRRHISSRVRAIAPFLRFDSNPYLVAVDTNGKSWERGADRAESSAANLTDDESYLYWIIDAYTTSNHFPYADPADNDFNYIRNSVKVVVDAYHGSVNFYVADPADPIIQSWQRIFPGMLQPIADMPEALKLHIRYPRDFYRVQSDQLMTYHMTDPVVFYNREDQWRAPNEIYANQPQLVNPYFLIMKLPIGDSEEFILLRPYTPVQRNNLIGWLAARSDGENYGKMLLYVFPKQRLVFGPEQIEARINQDPIISERISLWNRQGSRAIQGNLLVIPIEQSLLYVEPLYLVAEQNQLPTLARVIVAYDDRIVMAETLEAALAGIFQPTPTTSPIIRAVPEESADDLEAPELEAPELEAPSIVPPLDPSPTS